ncbi:hypothetical protein BFC17_08230 [Alteromonas lipolytica]|uniref:HTH araC/xylS-type domain-containing protein n=1 Tax=Alteromonas lipolytica TaxID=1856405 RepID=A0A1E8F8F2_9ALTE|nr:hypothetical protein BFC17_08230 [Alteromonas lipolytica]
MPVNTDGMQFHFNTGGVARVSTREQIITLHSGDILLFKPGMAHVICSSLDCSAIPFDKLPLKFVSEGYRTLELNGGGYTTNLLCGVISLSEAENRTLFTTLPDYLLIRTTAHHSSKLIRYFSELIMRETQENEKPAGSVITQLADVLMMSVLKECCNCVSSIPDSQIRYLNDQRIANAMQMLRDAPSAAWTLEKLAKKVGMSRTSFAVQFKDLVGHSPMDFLTACRMDQAFTALQYSDDSILSIALDAGYQSESAFSRAFKKAKGQTPGAVRKLAQNN